MGGFLFYKLLEPYAMKVARTVLRGAGGLYKPDQEVVTVKRT